MSPRPNRRGALGLLCGAGFGAMAGPLRAISISPVAWGNFGLEIERAQLTQGGWLRARLTKPGQVVGLQLGATAIQPDDNGRFFVGFDRDAQPSAYLIGACGSSEPCTFHGERPEFGLSIAPRAWQIEQIDAPLRPPSVPSEQFLAIRKGELAQIAAARALQTGARGWLQQMVRPAPGRISGRFGAQRIYRGEPGSYHTGLDLAAAAGTPILAPADGVVILAAAVPFTLEGKLLMVDHGMGLSSAFLHCSAHRVGEGDAVRQGQPIADVGMTGRATGPHLHWGLRWREARLDPLLFLPA